MSKQSRKQGVKKSDRTVEWCKLIIEDLKKGDRSSEELEKKYGIRKNSFPSLLLQLTYEAPIYDYKVGKVLYLGLIR